MNVRLIRTTSVWAAEYSSAMLKKNCPSLQVGKTFSHRKCTFEHRRSLLPIQRRNANAWNAWDYEQPLRDQSASCWNDCSRFKFSQINVEGRGRSSGQSVNDPLESAPADLRIAQMSGQCRLPMPSRWSLPASTDQRYESSAPNSTTPHYVRSKAPHDRDRRSS